MQNMEMLDTEGSFLVLVRNILIYTVDCRR
jgi:hypothetical protein